MSQRFIEMTVGLFLLAAIAALLVLAMKVSGLTSFFHTEGYTVTAMFDDIGQLKIRAPVKIGGVTIGEVTGIHLDSTEYRAVVSMRIDQKIKDIPEDSSASILTAGLLGDNYISLTPMYSDHYLTNNSEIHETHSALILEKLIGQLLFKLGNTNSSKGDAAATPNAKESRHD